MSSLFQIGSFTLLGVAGAALVTYLARRRTPGAGGGATLTRVTHLIPDASGTWMHVFGAQRLMPEYGDSSDVWYHMMVEPRSGRWVAGASAPGPDLDLTSPFVTRSMTQLAETLGFEPQLRPGAKLTLVVEGPRDHAETVRGPKRAVPTEGVVVVTGPERDARPTRACTATFYHRGQPVGSHAFAAIGGARFVARALGEVRVGFLSYVGMSFTDVTAHLVAFDLDSGAVLFDVPCRHRGTRAD